MRRDQSCRDGRGRTWVIRLCDYYLKKLESDVSLISKEKHIDRYHLPVWGLNIRISKLGRWKDHDSLVCSVKVSIRSWNQYSAFSIMKRLVILRESGMPCLVPPICIPNYKNSRLDGFKKDGHCIDSLWSFLIIVDRFISHESILKVVSTILIKKSYLRLCIRLLKATSICFTDIVKSNIIMAKLSRISIWERLLLVGYSSTWIN